MEVEEIFQYPGKSFAANLLLELDTKLELHACIFKKNVAVAMHSDYFSYGCE